MTAEKCQRVEIGNGFHECHHCEAMWGPMLNETGWRPQACPETPKDQKQPPLGSK